MQYIGVARLGLVQNATYTGTAAAVASGFSNGVQRIRVLATTDCYIKVDKAPTATTSDCYLPGLSAEYIIVNPGEKISAVQVSSGGVLNVTEVD